MRTQRSPLVNGRLYMMFLAATLAVCFAAVVDRTGTGGHSLVQSVNAALASESWERVVGALESVAGHEHAGGTPWSQLGQVIRSARNQECAIAAFRMEDLPQLVSEQSPQHVPEDLLPLDLRGQDIADGSDTYDDCPASPDEDDGACAEPELTRDVCPLSFFDEVIWGGLL
jgi:hypothetical protein